MLNIKNPEEYRLALRMMYLCESPKDPEVVVLYHKEFGVHSWEDKNNLNWAESQLRVRDSYIKTFEEKLKKAPKGFDEIIAKLPEDIYWPYLKAIKKGSEKKPKDQRKSLVINL